MGELAEVEKKIGEIFVTGQMKKSFRNVENCWFHEIKLFDEEDDKVRDHCHITAKYLGV